MNGRFEIQATPLPGLCVLQRKPVCDDRGCLDRVFCADELQEIFSGKNIAQVNHTSTRTRGTVRGMHFQHPPHAEIKLVSCLRGEVYDVAVDLRRGSPTFLHWHGEVLSAGNRKSLFIPEGFAHGFQALEDDCEMLYLHSAAYVPGAEGGLHPQDSKLGIAWPLEVLRLSPRDARHPFLDESFSGVMS